MKKNFFEKIEIISRLETMIGIKRRCGLFFAARLLPDVFDILLRFIYLQYLNTVILRGEIRSLKYIVLGYVICNFVKWITAYIDKLWKARIAMRMKICLQEKMMEKYFSQSISKCLEITSTDMKMRMEDDIAACQNIYINHFWGEIYLYVKIFALILILAMLSPKLCIVGMVFLPLSFWCTKVFAGKATGYSVSYQEYREKCSSMIKDSLYNWKEIKTDCIESFQVMSYAKLCSEKSNTFRKCQFYWFLNRAFIGIKDYLLTKINLYLVGGFMVISGQYTIGKLLYFIDLYSEVFACISSLCDSIVHFPENKKRYEKVMEIIDIEKPACLYEERQILSDSMEMTKIKYDYGTSEFEIFSENFRVETGEIVKIEGENGSGKTTFAKIIAGLFKPHRGKIYIDNEIVQFDTLTSNVTYLSQNPIFFNISIKDNLFLSRDNISICEINEVLDLVYLKNFVDMLPQGKDTIIGEKGIKLSGGEKQRLALARAVLRKTKIIILDEALNSVESSLAQLILDRIMYRFRDGIIIYVSHQDEISIKYSKKYIISRGIINKEYMNKEAG